MEIEICGWIVVHCCEISLGIDREMCCGIVSVVIEVEIYRRW
jgi:hypothetical protein